MNTAEDHAEAAAEQGERYRRQISMAVDQVKAIDLIYDPESDAPYAIGSYSLGEGEKPGTWTLWVVSHFPGDREEPASDDVTDVATYTNLGQAISSFMAYAAEEAADIALGILGEEGWARSEADTEIPF